LRPMSDCRMGIFTRTSPPPKKIRTRTSRRSPHIPWSYFFDFVPSPEPEETGKAIKIRHSRRNRRPEFPFSTYRNRLFNVKSLTKVSEFFALISEVINKHETCPSKSSGNTTRRQSCIFQEAAGKPLRISGNCSEFVGES
jgi:hypothetical protein